MVRKNQVGAAAVDVHLAVEVGRGHRRTLDVPTRPARAPRALPGRFTGFGRLPEGEVERVVLPLVDLDPGTGEQVVQRAVGELAVAGEGADPKVDIALYLVGVPLGDQTFD